MPVHPQSPHPSPTLNWHILWTHSDIPPSVFPLPVNLWTSKSSVVSTKEFLVRYLLVNIRFKIPAHFFCSGPLGLGFPPCHWWPTTPEGWSQSWLFPGHGWRSNGPQPSAGHLRGLFEGGMSVSSEAETDRQEDRHIYLHPKDNRRHNTTRSHIHKY